MSKHRGTVITYCSRSPR